MVMRRAAPRPLIAEAPGGGSPRGDARRRAILDAARELFLEHGFDGVAMSEVVNRSGGSLATVYQQFGSKEGLFAAILEELSADIVAPFLDESLESRPLEETLSWIGESFLERILRPDAIAWHRTCLTEGAKSPALREALFRTGPGCVRERLADYLAGQSRAGRIRIADPMLAAAQFLSLVKAGVHLEAMCGEPVIWNPGELRAHVDSAVEVFLDGTRI